MAENIQLRHPEKEEWGVLREIWCEAFPEDADGFCDFFLSRVTDPVKVLVAERNGRVESAVYILSCRHLCYGEFMADYLYAYGGGTRLDSRGHNYLRDMLQYAVELSPEQEKNGLCVTSAPELEACYDRWGYMQGAQLYETELNLENVIPLSLIWQDCSYETYRYLRHNYLSSLPSAIEWADDSDLLFFEDLQKSGRILTTCSDGRQYYAVCTETEDGWIMRETDFPFSKEFCASLAKELKCGNNLIVQSRMALNADSVSFCYCHYHALESDPSMETVYLNLLPE